jgi:hypothetical protein
VATDIYYKLTAMPTITRMTLALALSLTVLHLIFLNIVADGSIIADAGETASLSAASDNLKGKYIVHKGLHYSNATSWGRNSDLLFSVTATLPKAAAIYNCSGSCEDTVWYYDWNKLWGKARCGFLNSHHQDSDRFVWRRCSDATCASYIPDTERIEIATYSYDGGIIPYQQPEPNNLIQRFKYTIEPDIPYHYTIEMDSQGQSIFTLADSTGTPIESHTVIHSNVCADNYFEGTVLDLYFGGTCTAPEDVVAIYA